MDAPLVGILLGQLGSPEAPTKRAVRRFLAEFLSDPRVVEAPRWLWLPFLHAVILPRAASRSAALYRKIWTEGGSPLVRTTLEQAKLLADALGAPCRVEAGFRYGRPSVAEAIERLLAAGAKRLLVFPMFPQYASATMGSLFDAVASHLRGKREVPALRFVPPYYGHPSYIEALAAAAREDLSRLPWKPERTVLSFHGLGKKSVARGDPYQKHVETTARLLAQELGLAPAAYELAYQSRFGRGEWLEPSTEDTLRRLGACGIRRVAVICPGFLADCLETIEEIGTRATRTFREAGGEELHRVPCLGTHPAWISAMERIAREELSGWMEGP